MGINRRTKHGDSLFNLIFISFFVVIITNLKLLRRKNEFMNTNFYRVERNQLQENTLDAFSLVSIHRTVYKSKNIYWSKWSAVYDWYWVLWVIRNMSVCSFGIKGVSLIYLFFIIWLKLFTDFLLINNKSLALFYINRLLRLTCDFSRFI